MKNRISYIQIRLYSIYMRTGKECLVVYDIVWYNGTVYWSWIINYVNHESSTMIHVRCWFIVHDNLPGISLQQGVSSEHLILLEYVVAWASQVVWKELIIGLI